MHFGWQPRLALLHRDILSISRNLTYPLGDQFYLTVDGTVLKPVRGGGKGQLPGASGPEKVVSYSAGTSVNNLISITTMLE